MLYQPSYPSPYLSDVDGGHVNEFSCYINADGGTAVTAYRYQISDLNGIKLYTSSVISVQPVYAGEILTFNVPTSVGLVNGLDYTWNITLYEANPDIWITYGTVQSGNNTTTQVYLRPSFLIQAGMYLNINNQLRLINSYNSTNGLATLSSALTNSPAAGTQYNIYANNITSTEYFFRARTTPTLTMATVPSTLTNKSYTFNATYSQAENVGYKYYEWTIYDQSGNVLNRSGEINTGVIEYSFDGFINGNTYGIGLVLENQNGVVLTVQPRYFSVNYNLPELENSPSASVDCDNAAIKVVWSPLLINRGDVEHPASATSPYYTLVKNQPFAGGSSVKINKGNSLYWYIGTQSSPVYIPYESTTFINWHTDNPNFEGVIYRQEGEKVELNTFASTPPSSASIGDKYFNTNDKLIYTAVSRNTWGASGVTPQSDVIYYTLDTNLNYVWDGNAMSLTSYTTPYYQISYRDGAFYYDIENGDVSIHDYVFIETVVDKWLLQTKDTIDSNSYIWIDGLLWDDELFWTETGVSHIDKYWFKLALLPTELKIYRNAI